jgi:hypothetical protein
MTSVENLSNPDFEPSDQQLSDLIHGAFEDIPRRKQIRLEAMQARIFIAQKEFYRSLTEQEGNVG